MALTFQPVRVHRIKLIGKHRIALASDYPFPLGEHVPGRMIEQMSDPSDATKQRLLAGTALEFLGLDESRFSIAGMGEVKGSARAD